MTRPRILLADNHLEFLKTCAEFLSSSGYEILTASDPSEASRILTEDWVHLAVLDLRLERDYDDKDKSGLILARSVAPAVPKIILTLFPTHRDVREALIRDGDAPRAVDFLDKDDGLRGLLQAVKRALRDHLAVNLDLNIQYNDCAPVSFIQLARFIEPGVEPSRSVSRAEELEDLFRRLFVQESQIRLDRLVWQSNRRFAVGVVAFKMDNTPESYIVVCGKNARTTEELHRNEEFAPGARGDDATVLKRSSFTTHFVANAYSLAHGNVETAGSLRNVFRHGTDGALSSVLETLFQSALARWHQDQIVSKDKTSLDGLYRKRSPFPEARVLSRSLQDRVRSLSKLVYSLGARVDCTQEALFVTVLSRSYTYPDLVSHAVRGFDLEIPSLLKRTPGKLTGDNILTDESGHVWLTDFADAGLAPVLCNHIELESAIRFDWVESTKLDWLHTFEQALVFGDFTKPDTENIEQPLRKPLRAILAIRKHATQSVGWDPVAYHLGVFYEAISRLMEFNPKASLTQKELARLAHALLAAAMTSQYLQDAAKTQPPVRQAASKGLRLDTPNRTVYVDGRRVKLQGKRIEFALLSYLYGHADQVCSRADLISNVWEYTYDESDLSQRRILNTAIRRLREQIEVDPKRPRYIKTARGDGYRLVRRPVD